MAEKSELKIDIIAAHKKILLFLLIGFIIRIALIIFIPYPFYPVKIDDARGYDVLAWNILQGNGFSQMVEPPYHPDIIRTPGYPLFLSSIYLFFGHSYIAVRLIQAVLDVGTCLFIYLISRDIFCDNKDKEKIASLACLLSIIAPPLAFLVSTIYTETLSAFLITLSVYFTVRTKNSTKLKFFILSGLTMGYAILVRPVFALLPIFIAVIWVYQQRIKVIKPVLFYLVIVFLIIIPWTIRNYITFHKFIPLAMGFNLGLYKATWPPAKTEDDLKNKVPPDELKTFAEFILVPAEVSRKSGEDILKEEAELGRIAIAKMKKDIPGYLWLSLQRIPQLWVSSFSHFIQLDTPAGILLHQIKTDIDYHKIYILIFKAALSFLNLIYLLFGILGIAVLFITRHKQIIFALLPIAYLTALLPPLGHNLARYTVPVWPVFILFTAYGLWFTVRKVNSSWVILKK